jgi:hypothetical protein
MSIFKSFRLKVLMTSTVQDHITDSSIRISYLTPAEQLRKMKNFKVIFAFLTITNVVLIDSKPAAFNFDSLENALRGHS